MMRYSLRVTRHIKSLSRDKDATVSERGGEGERDRISREKHGRRRETEGEGGGEKREDVDGDQVVD